jgi:hypothetical protein
MSFKSRYAFDDDERAALRAEAAEDADRDLADELRRDEDDERDAPLDLVEAVFEPWLRGYRAAIRTEVR